MKVIRTFFAGLAGALAMSLTMYLIRQFGGINVSLEALLGSLVEPPGNLTPWMAGLLLHCALGVAVAYLYALSFEVVQRSGLMMGGGLGLAHGLIAGLFMSGIPAMNPLVPNITAPGAFLAHLTFGPVIFLFLHFIYGAVVGLVWGRPMPRVELTHSRVAH
jgi:hypothetical protein